MDLAALVAATARSTRPDGDGHLVVLERRLNAAPAEVWSAMTELERVGAWFEPVVVEGGRYRLAGSGTAGSVLVCERPALLRLTWEYDGASSPLEVALRMDGPGTLLRLAHGADDDEHWQEYGPGAAGVGWDGSLLALERHLGGGASEEPDGPAYVRATAAAWERAHRASGASIVAAKTAAARVAAFYTAG